MGTRCCGDTHGEFEWQIINLAQEILFQQKGDEEPQWLLQTKKCDRCMAVAAEFLKSLGLTTFRIYPGIFTRITGLLSRR